MDSTKLIVVIITLVVAIIKASQQSKTGKKPKKPAVNQTIQTIQRAVKAVETAAEQKRPTQQKDIWTNAANTVNRMESKNKKEATKNRSDVKSVEKKQNHGHKEVLSQEVSVKENLTAKTEPAQGDGLMEEIQNLMVEGYHGKLTYERDFVSEGIEMLNRFQIQSEV